RESSGNRSPGGSASDVAVIVPLRSVAASFAVHPGKPAVVQVGRDREQRRRRERGEGGGPRRGCRRNEGPVPIDPHGGADAYVVVRAEKFTGEVDDDGLVLSRRKTDVGNHRLPRP